MSQSSQSLRVAIVDTETTGLYPSQDRIIEIAIILVEAERQTGRIVGEVARYDALQDPGFPMPYGAFAVHGISDAMVRGQRIDAQAVSGLLSQAELLVAHNAGFDKGFVAQVMPECASLLWGCSCRGVPWRRHFPVPSAKLQTLADHLQLERGTAHRAMGDVETTLALLRTELPGEDMTALGHLIRKKLR
ncbi:MAG: polymerase subunit epsilon [Holophagaceae bacterium]|nr:polymerase subunit epsilon [Holophagaceae bacterium]